MVRRRAPKSATHQCLSQKEEDRRAAHEQECGPLTNENLEGEGSGGDLPLGVILWESKNTKRIGTGDSLLDNIKDNATLLGLQAVFAARPFPLGTASPPGLPHRTRLRPGSSSTVSEQHHDAGAGLAATSVLCLRPGPRFYAAPPNAAQRYAFANPQTLRSCPRSENHHGFQTVATRKRSTPSPACGRFTPSPICSAALRRRRSVYGYLVRHPHAKADGRRFGAARPLDDFADVDFRLGQLRTVGARLAVAPQTRGRFERHLSVEQLKKVIGHLFARPFE